MKSRRRTPWKRPFWARLIRNPQSLLMELGPGSAARHFLLPFVGGWGLCLLLVDWTNAAPEPLTGMWVSWSLVHGPFVGFLMWISLAVTLALLPNGPKFALAQAHAALAMAPLVIALILEVLGLYILDGSPLQQAGTSLLLSLPALAAGLYCIRLGGLSLQALGLGKGVRSYLWAGIFMALAAFIPFFLLAHLANLSVL